MRQALLLILSIIVNFVIGQTIIPAEIVKEKLKTSKFTQVDLFSPINNASRSSIPNDVQEYSLLKLKKESINLLLRGQQEGLEITIPSTNRSNIVVELVEVQNENYKVISAADKKQIKYKKGRHYRGRIKGNDKSLVALSFFENDVMGFVSTNRETGNLVIGKMKDNSDDFIIYRDDKMMQNLELNCGTKSGDVKYSPEVLHDHTQSNQRALTDCVKFFYEVDDDIVTDKGGSTPAINYVTGLHNQVSALYAAENINVLISEIFVWTTTSPYNAPTSALMLDQFTAQKNGFNGDFAMLLSYGASGGIAYVNTMCSNVSDYRMGFSSIYNTYATVPTYSWSVNVVTHEFGHLFGSSHTHDCVWNGNNTAIDGCAPVQGGCANPGLPAPGNGTIMSYCHTTSVGVNFAVGFGTQPGNVIRNSVITASCLTACPGGAPTCTDGIQNGAETGIDCGGPSCPACPPCSQNTGTVSITFDDYPTETSWTITNSSGVVILGGGFGGTYTNANSTISVPVCLPNGCYNFNIYDAFGDGICCLYGNGSYSVIINGTSVASGGAFANQQITPFCLSAASSCNDGIQNGNETSIDCGGSCGYPIVSITGATNICPGTTTTLNFTSGGTWSSSNTAVATVTNAGVVTGVTAGTATFTYTKNNGCTSLPSSPITVNVKPTVSISGASNICIGSTTTLSPSSGGTWSSSNSAVATVTNGGVVTGVSAGNATFTFTNSATACVSNPTGAIIINAKPPVSIIGANAICIGSTTTLSPSSGGTWSSSNSAVATVTNGGVVTGVSAGSATFTFTNSATACVSNPTGAITINATTPVSIIGANAICIGSTTTLSPSSGGTWSSSNSAVATVTNGGVVTGVSAGNATFTFTSNTGCVSLPTNSITINSIPTVSITGASPICMGSTTTLSPVSGGTWTSGNPTVASVTNSGLVTGLNFGNLIFTFTSNEGCVSLPTNSLTINSKPIVTVTSASTICAGLTTTLSVTNAGPLLGNWSSNNPTIGTITNGGVVTGVSEGSATFIYTNIIGCTSNPSSPITINPKPIVSITGSSSICVGVTTTLSPSTGGTWESSNTSVATVDNSGVVTGLSAGSATFIFTSNATGCVSLPTNNINVNPLPTVFADSDSSMCIGMYRTVSPNIGGYWISNNPSIAEISTDGVIYGLSPGNPTFTFTDSITGCSSNINNFIVHSNPEISFTGSSSICVLDSIGVLPINGGTWTSDTSNVYYNNNGFFVSTGSGTALIVYKDSIHNCKNILFINVTNCTTCNDGIQNGDETGIDCGGSCPPCGTCNDGIQNGNETSVDCGGSCGYPQVDFTGPSTICQGDTTTLSPMTGGTWTSSNPSVASIASNGYVVGISGGNSTFTFTNSNGCSSQPSNILTVNPTPIVSLNGTNNICQGATTTLSPATGGTWASSDLNIADFINPGVVRGVSEGTAYFTFTSDNGCVSNPTDNITVNPKPIVTVNGPTSICTGATTNLNPTSGGTWFSTVPSVATIDNTGTVLGVSGGVVFFVFVDGNGCASGPTARTTVYNKPIVSILGSTTMCQGGSNTVTPATGGTWTSSGPLVATVNNAGIVNTISAGIVNFTFTNNNGCSSTTPNITVNPKPIVSITGPTSICQGSTTTLSPVTGGTWGTTLGSPATVTNAGIVTGVLVGNALFTFTSTAGCQSDPTPFVTVNALPAVYNNGSPSICQGTTSTLSPSTGGSWFSSNAGVATVTNQGLVTGVSPGSASFTFTSSNGCTPAALTVSVLAKPSATITGLNSICQGTTTTLSPTSGGTWVSSNNAVATVSNAGVVTGVAAGTASFTFITNCASDPTPPITINDNPIATITGSSTICAGSNTTLSPNAGGTWASSNTAIATVTNAGVVTGVSAGTATFIFTSTVGCVSNPTSSIIIIAKPIVSITGASAICQGATTTLSPATGGTWISSNTAIATVTNAGVVTGVSGGIVTFTFTSTASGCVSNPTSAITINAKPIVSITGASAICIGTTTTLSPTSGGTWISSNNARATVTNAGVVTGVSVGTATFTFTSTAGCVSNPSATITVNGKPTVSITGATSICQGVTTTLSPTTGGTWTSSNIAIATVTNAGIVTGVSAGTATFTFTSSTTGCASNPTAAITIKAKPVVSITGASAICQTFTTTLSPTTGGTWASSSTAIATVTNAGIVTGVSSGSATFTFTSTTTACPSLPTNPITVNVKPTVAISGATSICVASTTTLTPSTGGTWASSNTAVATVTNAGVVTGVTAGTATFTFTSTAGCVSNPTASLTVNTKPTASVTGQGTICAGSTTTLSPTTGGTWTSSNISIATVTNAGVVTGVSAGSVTFTFTSTAGCASSPTASILVNAKPTVSVTGSTSVCVGSTTTLSPTTGGTWLSSNTTIATITPSGIVTAVGSGVVTFTFTNSVTGCSNTLSLTMGCVTNLGGYYFETGWDSWVDGGTDAERYTGVNSYEGVWSIALRDNNLVQSSMTSPTYDLSTHASVKVQFAFKMISVETGEDLWLQFSNNNGSTWTTTNTWVRGSTYSNNVFYQASAILNKTQYALNATTKFRLVSDASDATDLFYIDAVVVTGYPTSQANGNTPVISSLVENEADKAITQIESIENIAFKIFPNPAFDVINLEMNNFKLNDKIDLVIYDHTGKIVSANKLDAEKMQRVDVSSLMSGLYMIRISVNEEEKVIKKFIITK